MKKTKLALSFIIVLIAFEPLRIVIGKIADRIWKLNAGKRKKISQQNLQKQLNEVDEYYDQKLKQLEDK